MPTDPKSEVWLRTVLPGTEAVVHARYGLGSRGEPLVTAIMIEAPSIDAALMAKVKPARLIAAANLSPPIVAPGGPVTVVGQRGRIVTQAVSRAAVGRTTPKPHLAPPVLIQSGLTGPDSERQIQPVDRRRRRPLKRPDGKNPDAFYAKVAKAYHSARIGSSKPAVLLAEEAGVPVETARGWIKEARRRGHLAPATKGRAT